MTADLDVRAPSDPLAAVAAAHQFYRQRFPDSWAAQYVTGRGLDEGVQENAGVGYAPASWNELTRHLSREGFSEQTQLDAGLVARGSNGHLYDRYRDRVVFPIRANDGGVVGFAGRKAETDDSPDVPKWLTPPNSVAFQKRDFLFGMEGLAQGDGRALVGEGVFDAYALSRVGEGSGVALMGTALTDEHCMALKAAGVTDVSMVLDGDRAGRTAAASSWSALRAHGLNGYAVTLPDGLDPAELDPEALVQAVRDRRPLLDHVVDQRLDGWAGTDLSIENRVAAMRSLGPLLADVDTDTARAQWIRASAALDLAPETTASVAAEFAPATDDDFVPEPLSNIVEDIPAPATEATVTGPQMDDLDSDQPLLARIEGAQAGRTFIVNDDSLAGGTVHIPEDVSVHVTGSARVGSLIGDGVVTLDESAHVDRVGGGLRVERMDGKSRITVLGDTAHAGVLTGRTHIDRVGDRARVDHVTDAAHLGHVGGHSQIARIDGATTVGTVADKATLRSVSGKARIGFLGNVANVEYLGGQASIGRVHESGHVHKAGADAHIDLVDDNARIGRLADRAQVRELAGRSRIGFVEDDAGVQTARDYSTISTVTGNGSLKARGRFAHVGSADPTADVAQPGSLEAAERQAYNNWSNRNTPPGRRLRPPRLGYMGMHAGRLLTAEVRRELRDGDKREAAHQAVDR